MQFEAIWPLTWSPARDDLDCGYFLLRLPNFPPFPTPFPPLPPLPPACDTVLYIRTNLIDLTPQDTFPREVHFVRLRPEVVNIGQ